MNTIPKISLGITVSIIIIGALYVFLKQHNNTNHNTTGGITKNSISYTKTPHHNIILSEQHIGILPIDPSQNRLTQDNNQLNNICESTEWVINCTIPTNNATYTLQSDEGGKYTLFKNNNQIRQKQLIYGAEDPLIDIFVFNDSLVFSYVDRSKQPIMNDIVINGESMNEKYGLENTHNPAIIANQLVFLGKKDKNTYIIINETIKQLQYEEIFHNGCCSIGGHNPTNNASSLSFYAKRADEWFITHISINRKDVQ